MVVACRLDPRNPRSSASGIASADSAALRVYDWFDYDYEHDYEHDDEHEHDWK
jgi:hypothetical protein